MSRSGFEIALLLLRRAVVRENLGIAGIRRLAAEHHRREARAAENFVDERELHLADSPARPIRGRDDRPTAHASSPGPAKDAPARCALDFVPRRGSRGRGPAVRLLPSRRLRSNPVPSETPDLFRNPTTWFPLLLFLVSHRRPIKRVTGPIGNSCQSNPVRLSIVLPSECPSWETERWNSRARSPSFNIFRSNHSI